jgi:nucleoside-diphosphate-sugar epimerase
VTGGTGLIGRHAVRALLSRGFEVHAAVRTVGDEAAREPRARWSTVEILDPNAMRGLIERVKPSHFLHLAWETTHGLFWKSPLNLDWHAASVQALRVFAGLGGRRWVGAGTCAEYDWSANTDTADCREFGTPMRPAQLYGAAKAATYLLSQAIAAELGMSFAWGRIFQPFGPGEDPRRIVPLLVRAHVRGDTVECSQGTQWRDFLSSSDYGEAFAHMCESGIEGAVNLGSGLPTTLRALSERIAGLAGKSGTVRFGTFHDPGPERLLPNLRRMREELGWAPPSSLDDALSATIRAQRTHDSSGPSFRGAKA